MNQTEILLVTNYFPPEKGAAANRMESLAKGLTGRGYKVSIICPLPNYPEGQIFPAYKGKVYRKKSEDGITVYRLWVWASNSRNKFVRLASMFSFSLSLALFFLLKRTPKKVFVQYSPIFVGFTAVLWARLLGKKVILNVSDLWPLAGLEMGLLKKGFYYSLLLKIERFCFRNSQLIVGQSQEILDHAKGLQIKAPTFLYRNLPSFEGTSVGKNPDGKRIRIVYAGLLGMAQGIYDICQTVAFSENVSFHIYGSGPELNQIIALQKEHIHVHGSLEREVLHRELKDYDIAFIPLVKRIYGSVPSKIFEYSRLGLPLLYFGGGEGEGIVEKNGLGWVVPAGNKERLKEFVDALSAEVLNPFPKKEIQKKAERAFDFEKQFDLFLQKLQSL